MLRKERKASRKAIITAESFVSPEAERMYRFFEQALLDKRREVLNKNRKKRHKKIKSD